MAILESASIHDLKRLLELFPIANIRGVWPKLKGTKEDLCFSIAENKDLAGLLTFISENLSCCKQHVYVYTHGPELTKLPAVAPSGERVVDGGDRALYLIRVRYGIVLRAPLEETELDFLWPISLQLTADHLIVRFVTLETNLNSYFDRPNYISSRSVDEATILDSLAGNLRRADLHKGVKKLWDDTFMDSPRAKFKKPTSMASEAMDEERGIREYNRELYETLLNSVLLNTLFVIPEDKDCSVSAFSVDPSTGVLVFPRYSERKGDTDFVIGEIIRYNQ